jgi:hypothetical protein
LIGPRALGALNRSPARCWHWASVFQRSFFHNQTAQHVDNIVKLIAPKGRVCLSMIRLTLTALHSFTRGLSRELGPQGITVNLVSPGSTVTEANPADGASADFQRSLSSIGRFAEPREIADVVAFLVSPGANMITGTTVTVDGGANA